MNFPYAEAFLALFLAYMVYSAWAGIDPRYPIGAALALLVATAIVDALGDVATANTLAEYVFFLLGGGVILLLIDHVRESRAGRSAPDSAQTTASQRVTSDSPEER